MLQISGVCCAGMSMLTALLNTVAPTRRAESRIERYSQMGFKFYKKQLRVAPTEALGAANYSIILMSLTPSAGHALSHG